MSNPLKEHYKHVKKIVEEAPDKLEGLYVFIFIKKKQHWKRVLLQNYIQPGPEEDASEKRLFNAIYQDKLLSKGQINMLKWMFIIDCRYGDQESDQPSGQPAA